MRSLNLCIDIDGTITEPYYWLSHANQYFNTQLKPKDVTIYDIHKLLGIDISEYDQFYHMYGERLHREAKIRSGAMEIINKFYGSHMIHLVTAREETMRNVTLEWLIRHQIMTDSVTLLGSNNKVNQAKLLDCDIFIEDRYENAIQLSEAGFDVILIDCNYNRGALPSNVTRVKSWPQIDKLIEKYVPGYIELELAFE